MKVFSTAQIRDLDAYTIGHEPVTSIELMERAAEGCSAWVAAHYSPETPLVFFTGPGNNGGDGWAMARQLVGKGFQGIRLYYLEEARSMSPDAAFNRKRLEDQGRVKIFAISAETEFPALKKNEVVVDALFGSGLKGPLQGLPASLVAHINSSGCSVISVDIPSGLHGEDNSGFVGAPVIRAKDTLTLEFPKRAFFYAENYEYTGHWHIIPIGLHAGKVAETETPFGYLTATDLAGKIPARALFSHKGTYGHALLIAGSYGMLGAAILSARACLRSGVGLLTTHIPAAGYPVVQGAVPESIFSLDPSPHIWSSLPAGKTCNAAGIGPGIGTAPETLKALESALTNLTIPLVLDADALNLLAQKPELMDAVPKNTILTPHPGEFDRLTGKSADGHSRNKKQIELARGKGLIIILKGAYTSIALPDGRCTFNSTGNPGMATPGAGDVLTGIILALLAQGFSPADAALTGTYIHGLAGDLALAQMGPQAIIASDLTDNLGNAFKTIETYVKKP